MIHFNCFKNELYEAVTKVASCTIVRTTMPFLEFIRLRINGNDLELNGYNLDYGIKTNVSIEGGKEQKGEFLVSPRLLSEVVRKMDGESISVDIDDNYVITLRGGVTEMTISAGNAAEYPDLPVVEQEHTIKINEGTLKSMIDQTKYASSNNEMKPVMMGEFFDIKDGILNLVAVDGYRLAIRTESVQADSDIGFIIHKKALNLIESFLSDDSEREVVIYTNSKHACFILENCIFTVRLMEGVFHNYKSSIPQNLSTEVIADSVKLLRSLERCDIIINDRNKSPIICNFTKGNLNIKCETKLGRVNDYVPVQITGDEMVIGFNNSFLLDAVRNSKCDKIKIHLINDRSIVEILPMEGDSFRFLLMPIRIKDK